MKRLKQKLIPAVLALMVALPVGAYAAQSQDQPDKTAQTEKQQTRAGEGWKSNDGKHGDFNHRHEKMQEFELHYQNYMLLLAEKYTPGQLNEWKAVFAQRKALLEQWKNKAADHRKQTAAEFRSDFKAKAQDIKKKAENGEITKDEAKKQLQALKKQFAEQRKEKQTQIREKAKFLPEKSEERKMLRKQFTQAVKNNDEAGIKAMLPKLLEQQKKINEHISTMLKQTSKQS